MSKKAKRLAYIEGYEQAEKDMAWEVNHREEAYMDGMKEGLKKGGKDTIEKACDVYCEVCGHYAHTVPAHICRQACDYYKSFRNKMEE